MQSQKVNHLLYHTQHLYSNFSIILHRRAQIYVGSDIAMGCHASDLSSLVYASSAMLLFLSTPDPAMYNRPTTRVITDHENDIISKVIEDDNI